MEAGVETLGNFLLVVLILLLVISVGDLFLSAKQLVSKHRKWDFFFSYKSENANEVRRIAERLMAVGYRVWFAEYEIVLRNYDEFEHFIREGIQNCSFGILFTTNKYTKSENCINEVKWLQQHFEKERWRIIEVSLEEPNDALNAFGLSESQRIVANLSHKAYQEHGEDDDLLTRLSSLTKFDLNRGYTVPQFSAISPPFRARCAPISFNPSGFVLKEWKVHPIDGTDVVFFEGEPGPVRFSFNVYFHYSPQKAPWQPFTIGDDRMLYTELRAYATRFMKKIGKRGIFLRERGLHLIWTKRGTQFALTHSFLGFRMRKYSVILSQLSQPIQLIFTFGVTGGFEDFYCYVPLMDRVIESIRTEIDGASTYPSKS